MAYDEGAAIQETISVDVQTVTLTADQSVVIYDPDGNVMFQTTGPCIVRTPAGLTVGVGTPDDISAVKMQLADYRATGVLSMTGPTRGDNLTPIGRVDGGAMPPQRIQ